MIWDTFAIALLVTTVLAVPVPQANKIGAGVSSIATGLDDGSGYLVENVGTSVGNDEEGLAKLGDLGTATAPAPSKRQANKIGAGVSSIATGLDDGSGYLVENLGDSVGNTEEGLAGAGNLPATTTRREAHPEPQFANTGDGAEQLLDGVDTGVGQGSQDALTNAGQLVATEGVAAGDVVPARTRRQFANTGEGAEQLLDGVDTGVGQGSQDALTNAGQLVATEGVAAGNLVPA